MTTTWLLKVLVSYTTASNVSIASLAALTASGGTTTLVVICRFDIDAFVENEVTFSFVLIEDVLLSCFRSFFVGKLH